RAAAMDRLVAKTYVRDVDTSARAYVFLPRRRGGPHGCDGGLVPGPRGRRPGVRRAQAVARRTARADRVGAGGAGGRGFRTRRAGRSRTGDVCAELARRRACSTATVHGCSPRMPLLALWRLAEDLGLDTGRIDGPVQLARSLRSSIDDAARRGRPHFLAFDDL